MRQLLTDSLARGELGFEFQVRLRTPVSLMSIEDATVERRGAESPYKTVATLHLSQQIVLSVEEASSEEHRSFDVWSGLVDHRPLGGIS